MAKRAASICSSAELLDAEFKYIGKVFIELNDYPPKLVKSIIESVKEEGDRETSQENPSQTTNVEPITATPVNEEKQIVTLCVPYAGRKGENLMDKLKKELKRTLPENVKAQITYKATKLQTKFQVKDRIQFENQHNVTYLATCPKCKHRYIGETKCRCKKRVIEHNSKDKKSHLVKHAQSTKHKRVWLPDFKILGKGYTSDFKRKISESLHIKQHKPEINVQKDAYKLKLFY